VGRSPQAGPKRLARDLHHFYRTWIEKSVENRSYGEQYLKRYRFFDPYLDRTLNSRTLAPAAVLSLSGAFALHHPPALRAVVSPSRSRRLSSSTRPGRLSAPSPSQIYALAVCLARRRLTVGMAPALIGRSASEEYATLRELFRPHVESFDYFLEKGLDKMLESIRPMEVKDPNSNKFLRNILHASNSSFFLYLCMCGFCFCFSLQLCCVLPPVFSC
jgi:hypothetical protein